MLKKLLCIGPMFFAGTTGVKAQDIQWWGNYLDGAYPIADHRLRFYAISYQGTLNDTNKIKAQAAKAVTELNRVDKTHELKDGNGIFNVVRLDPDRVFVIDAYNPSNGDHCWMATVPGRGTVVVTNDQGTL